MFGPLVADSSGNLFGLGYIGGANNDGAAFELSPPASGQTVWTVNVLHSFDGTDGIGPNAGLLLVSGALYGMTSGYNGQVNDGNVFKLTPPPKGSMNWSFTVLHTFNGADGDYPGSTLSMDAAGALYGSTTTGGAHGLGLVFKLSPPAPGRSKWTETVIHSFSGGSDGEYPQSNTGLVIDAKGNLYGTTTQGGADNEGIAFEMSPPTGCGLWAESILYTFSAPSTGLISMSQPGGPFYGVGIGGGNTACSGGCGTIFELAPPPSGNGTWIETPLFAFDGDNGAAPSGITADTHGNLFGLARYGGGATNNGVIFKLTQPSSPNSPWTINVLHSFTGDPDAAQPNDAPVLGKKGLYYGNSIIGGSSNLGAIFDFSP
jgi:uncharacterized repeat protein (TIGR03803 family)